MTRRQKAILKRNLILAGLGAVLIAIIVGIVLGIVMIVNAFKGNNNTAPSQNKPTASQTETTDKDESKPSAPPSQESPAGTDLDTAFSRLLLVNAKNPLPKDYNYGANLTKIPAEYHNGELDEINADIWPYMKAMIEAAWKDGVDLKVWSPYRSYETQNRLFENQVARYDGDVERAATVVAKPGTSEHNTGLCADFNMASDQFESTPMFIWMQKNAEDYGFILRYPESMIDQTGVIYESWHWRFVGIDAAHEINDMGLTLEQYIDEKGLEPQPKKELN